MVQPDRAARVNRRAGTRGRASWPTVSLLVGAGSLARLWIVCVAVLAARGRTASNVQRELDRQYSHELAVLRGWCIRKAAESGENWGFGIGEPRFETLVPELFGDPRVRGLRVWHEHDGDRGNCM